MDPTACLSNLLLELEHLAANPGDAASRSYCADTLRDLVDWLESGGFPPDLARAVRTAELDME